MKELSGVLIAVIDTNAAAKNANIEANSEITWKHGKSRTVLLEDHLSLQENTLRGATVDLLGLTNHD